LAPFVAVCVSQVAFPGVLGSPPQIVVHAQATVEAHMALAAEHGIMTAVLSPQYRAMLRSRRGRGSRTLPLLQSREDLYDKQRLPQQGFTVQADAEALRD